MASLSLYMPAGVRHLLGATVIFHPVSTTRILHDVGAFVGGRDVLVVRPLSCGRDTPCDRFIIDLLSAERVSVLCSSTTALVDTTAFHERVRVAGWTTADRKFLGKRIV
jgi:hypothetical protein